MTKSAEGLKTKFSVSFSKKSVVVPMNQLLREWEREGLNKGTVATNYILEMHRIKQSSKLSHILSTYNYIYDSLEHVYGVATPELYQAVDEVLMQVFAVQADAMQLVDKKITENFNKPKPTTKEEAEFEHMQQEKRLEKQKKSTQIMETSVSSLPIIEATEGNSTHQPSESVATFVKTKTDETEKQIPSKPISPQPTNSGSNPMTKPRRPMVGRPLGGIDVNQSNNENPSEEQNETPKKLGGLNAFKSATTLRKQNS